MRLTRMLTLGALLLAPCLRARGWGQRIGATPAPRAPPQTAAPSRCSRPSSAAVPGSQSADDQDRLGRLRRGPGHGRDLRAGPRGKRLHRRPNRHRPGRSRVVAPAIESGQIDLQPEYIGSRISYEVKLANPSGPPASGGITGPTGDSATNLTDLQRS